MKKIYILLMVLLMSSLLVSCKEEKVESKEVELEDFYTNAEYIYVDYTHELLTFELMLLTKDVVEDIQVIAVEGEGITIADFDISVADNNIDLIKNFTYKKLHPSVWYFNIEPKENVDNVSISKMILLVNGNEQEVEFENELKLAKGDGTKFSGNMQPGVIPMEFPSSMINGDLTPTYSFTALEDISIEKIYTNGDVEPMVKAMMINGEEIEDIEFPITLKKDDVIEMNIGFSSENLTKYNYVLTDIYVDYMATNSTDSFKSIIMTSPVYPIVEDDLTPLEKYIDKIIGE